MYLGLKHAHLTFVLLSIVLFYYRFFVKQIAGKELPKILKILPHIIDTCLIASAVGLCILLQQYPLVVTWLTFKVFFVIGYIVFALFAMKAQQKAKAIQWLSAASICLIMAAFMAIKKTAI